MSDRLRIFMPSLRIGGEGEEFIELPADANWSALCVGARIVWTPDGRPIRRLSPRSKRRIGVVASRKTGLGVTHESRGHGPVGGEKLAIMRCEIDPDVDDFRTQHIRFETVLDGRPRVHFPDIVKLWRDGVIEVEEIKSDDRWKADEDYRRLIELARSVFADVGWIYRVSTARDIAPTPLVRDNIVQIHCERWVDFSQVELAAVLNVLRSGGGRAPLADLKRALGGRPGAAAIVRGMMCHGHLRLPLDARIGDSTLVERVDRRSAVRRSSPQ